MDIDKIPLCKCTECGTVYIDNNHSSNSNLYDYDYQPSLSLLEDEDGTYYGCLICQTDGYLIDL